MSSIHIWVEARKSKKINHFLFFWSPLPLQLKNISLTPKDFFSCHWWWLLLLLLPSWSSSTSKSCHGIFLLFF